MTRLACFYTRLDPRVATSLINYSAGLDIDWVETPDPGMTFANELDKRWTGEDDLIVVEQDKEVFPSTIQEIAACAAPWCSCTYWLFPEPHTTLCTGGFGVTKFSAAIQRSVSVGEFAGDRQQGIDRRFHDVLLARGIGCCLHSMVLHHHVYEPRPLAVREHVRKLRKQGLLPPAMYPEPLAPHLLPGSYDLVR